MKKITIFTDGGSRNNPGPSAVGVVFCNEKGQSFKEYGEYLGDNMTNNEAEYRAVIFALSKFKALFGKKLAENTEIELRADSELVVKQLNGQYRLENPKIQQFFIEIWNLKFDFKSVKFKHIPRERNREADRLVNKALNAEGTAQKIF